MPFIYMYPNLKFKISCNKDIETFFAFVNGAEFDEGRSLEWAIFKIYPEFKKYKKNNTIKVSKKHVSDFVNKEYKKNYKKFLYNLNKYKKNWHNVKEEYYNMVDELFDSKFWPDGRYVAYTTIWGMFPRFLEDSTFQIPAKHKSPNYVNVIIAHEMLHFIFYNYLFSKYPKYSKEKYQLFVWHLSEIFNALIQNSSKWLKIFKEKQMLYPEHEEIIKKLSSKYYNRKDLDVDEIIDSVIKEINKNKLS